MAYDFYEIEPLKKRKINNISQIRDNSDERDLCLFKGKANSFVLSRRGEDTWVSAPLEDSLEEPLVEMIDFLLDEVSPNIHLDSFPHMATERNHYVIDFVSQEDHARIYQTPLSIDQYNKKLEKFKKSRYTYRKLSQKNIPEMIKLKTMWAREKFNTTFRKANRRVEIASIFDLKNIVAEYNQHVEELDGIRMVPGESEFLTTFKQELSAFYGAFLDDQLVSYCEVEGNDSFMAFHSRASVRVNGLSPQEFLDYNLVRDFSRRGVKILDRGFINEPRDGDSGLIEYKKKFGPIIPKVETNYDYVTTSKTAQRVYLDNLFGLVYGK